MFSSVHFRLQETKPNPKGLRQRKGSTNQLAWKIQERTGFCFQSVVPLCFLKSAFFWVKFILAWPLLWGSFSSLMGKQPHKFKFKVADSSLSKDSNKSLHRLLWSWFGPHVHPWPNNCKEQRANDYLNKQACFLWTSLPGCPGRAWEQLAWATGRFYWKNRQCDLLGKHHGCPKQKINFLPKGTYWDKLRK